MRFFFNFFILKLFFHHDTLYVDSLFVFLSIHGIKKNFYGFRINLISFNIVGKETMKMLLYKNINQSLNY